MPTTTAPDSGAPSLPTPAHTDTITIILLVALVVVPIAGVAWYMRPIDWPIGADEARRKQAEAAEGLGVRVTETKTIAQGVVIDLVLVPPGDFMVGSPRGEPHREDDEELGRVSIPRAFYIGATEVTVGQFGAFVAANAYRTDAERDGLARINVGPEKDWEDRVGASWRAPGFEQTDDHPVVCVTSSDAQAFCRWLSTMWGHRVRLPTDEEWEYACRAGTNTAYHWGDDYREASSYCNLAGAEAKAHWPKWSDCTDWSDGFVFTAPVRTFQPNAYGLFDMSGNAEEFTAAGWCRGGSWNLDPWWHCRSAHLSPNSACGSSDGFRIVAEVD